MQQRVVIIGGGPAGLTAAYLLAKQNIAVTLLEADPVYVGGIARTVTYKGYGFDIGGHRFFSKSKEIEDFWSEILPNDLLERTRSSRIFYKNKFFNYPLNAKEVLTKLGIIQSALCFFSYLCAKIWPVKHPKTFTDWVSNHFGKRLFNIFFKTYTEKVWGMCCNEISADWAAQRIKGLSLWSAMVNALFSQKKTNNKKAKNQGKIIKTLIDSFRYPRRGPGMLWEVCAEKTRQLGGTIQLGCRVTRCVQAGPNVPWQIDYQNQQGKTQTISATHLISSAALRSLVCHYLPDLPTQTIQAAKQLKYRDFLIVALILKDKKQFSDNWIYIHDPTVAVARIQNFKSWSEALVPDQSMCCYGMEYFCFKNDGLWALDDASLIRKAIAECEKIGLAKAADIVDSCVVRQPKAYPVYDETYQQNVSLIRDTLEKTYPSLFLIGRNGMHKYNNQDHAMMTAMLAVKNILAGYRQFDLWQVNQDAEYHESNSSTGLRHVPQKI